MKEYDSQSTKEYAPQPEEYSFGKEFAAFEDNEYAKAEFEYSERRDEFNSQLKAVKPVRKKRSKEKLLRKMTYLAASCVSVVVIGQTLDLPSSVQQGGGTEEIIVENSKEQETIEEAKEIFLPQMELKEQKRENSVSGRKAKVISLEGYDSWGSSNGNVIPIMKGDLWGLMDYDGNVLVEPTYPVFHSSPNFNGYSIMGDGKKYYVLDREGKVCQSFPASYYVIIGEGDIIATRSYDTGEEYWKSRISYIRPDGTVLHDTGFIDSVYAEVVPFHEGKAYYYLALPEEEMEHDELNELYALYEVTPEGHVTVVLQDFPKEEQPDSGQDETTTGSGLIIGFNGSGYVSGKELNARAPSGVVAQGCIVGWVPPIEGVYLVQPSTGLITNEYSNSGLKSYKVNGGYAFNYYTYGVLDTWYDRENSTYIEDKDFLFDFNDVVVMDWRGNEVSEFIAIYDEILFNDYPYLAVREGEEAFYIDFKGNVVSPVYQQATSFNDYGYAMIMEEDGNAYIINNRFEKVETVGSVAEIGNSDETFAYIDGNDTVFLYYYPGEE